jgi:hypothetical protein
VIVALILHFGGLAQSVAQTGDVDPERVAAAHAFLVATRAAEQLLDGFKRYPPSSDDYMEQFADRLPDEAARQRFREAFDRIQPEVIDKAMARSRQLIDRVALAYARHFSIEELNSGTEFYRSPVGRKLLSSTATIADIVNGTISAPAERMQTARALVDILKQTDPFTAAIVTPPQTYYYLPNAAGSADDTTERTDPSPEDEAATRFENLAAAYARDFNVDELNSLSAFFRSPFAQKMGSVQPKLDGELMNLTVEWFDPFRGSWKQGLQKQCRRWPTNDHRAGSLALPNCFWTRSQ